MFLKTMKKKENKHRKIALLARSKFNSIEKIFKALTDSDLSHDKFTLVIDEEQNYFKQEESTTTVTFERDRLFEHGKRIVQNERKRLN